MVRQTLILNDIPFGKHTCLCVAQIVLGCVPVHPGDAGCSLIGKRMTPQLDPNFYSAILAMLRLESMVVMR